MLKSKLCSDGLENLVALNADRAEEERNGLIRWLRPDYQSPEQAPQQVTQIAAQFKGRTTQKKLDAIAENLQRLEWFGLVICDPASGNWHYAESTQAA